MSGVREIGSEFWQAECGGAYQGRGNTYLSGRTALSAILLDLKARGADSVCLPDYCCESMIEPFLRQNIRIGFYPTAADSSGIILFPDAAAGFDAILLVNYFGFMTERVEMCARQCRERGQLVLLDLTHAVFETERAWPADYIFGSYRKWSGVEAGFAWRQGGENVVLPAWPLNRAGLRYLELRRRAREQKTAFVTGGYEDERLRRAQLAAFSEAEEMLDADYLSDTDEENKARLRSLDGAYIKARRRENAAVVYQYLARIKGCRPLFPALDADVTPLAVPVLAEGGQRAPLRAFLREHGVFCPVHWPLSAMHRTGPACRELYENELSLVCDQRYDASDMVRMMETVEQWERMQFV